MEWLGAVVRFIASAVVLMLLSFVLPGFKAIGFVTALIASVVIAAIGWAIEATLGKAVSPYGRGLVGFLTSAAVIWAAQWVVPGLSLTVVGALLAAFIIGIIDLFVPTVVR